jgi:hypothetical protein
VSIWVPVVVALVTAVVSWAAVRLSRELSRRNLRTRIAADLAIYNGLGDEFRKRPLRESVDARLWQLAAQSMPLAPGSRPKPRIRRILALVAGVIGTKWGWSDDRSFHASASFGPDFSVAASTYGSAGQLSEHVLGAFAEGVPPGPETGPFLQDCPPLGRFAGDPLLGPPAQDLLDGLPPVVTDPICG